MPVSTAFWTFSARSRPSFSVGFPSFWCPRKLLSGDENTTENDGVHGFLDVFGGIEIFVFSGVSSGFCPSMRKSPKIDKKYRPLLMILDHFPSSLTVRRKWTNPHYICHFWGSLGRRGSGVGQQPKNDRYHGGFVRFLPLDEKIAKNPFSEPPLPDGATEVDGSPLYPSLLGVAGQAGG